MDSCMCTYATVQQLFCHGIYCELILSLARTSCRFFLTNVGFKPVQSRLNQVCSEKNVFWVCVKGANWVHLTFGYDFQIHFDTGGKWGFCQKKSC